MSLKCGSTVLLMAGVGLLLSGCVATNSAFPSPETQRESFNKAVAAFTNSFIRSQAVKEFTQRFNGSKPTIEIARPRGLSTNDERFLRYHLVKNFLLHEDKIALVIGPGQSRRSASRERFYMMRHGKIADDLPVPGHLRSADFMIIATSSRNPESDRQQAWLTAISLANNQIVDEQAVPFSGSFEGGSSSQSNSPSTQRVRFKVISDLSLPVAVWLNPTFPTWGANGSGPIPSDTPPTTVINPGKSAITEVFSGYRKGRIFICVQGVLYRNVCRKYYVPYDDGKAIPFEITGVDQYGFIVARKIPEK